MKFLLLFVLSVVLIYCKSDKTIIQTIQDHVESYLKSHEQDAAGYEFVAITDLDTITAKDYLDKELEIMTLALMNKEERLRKLESSEAEAKKTLSTNPNDQTALTNIQEVASAKASINHKQHRLDSLTSAIKPELAQTIKFIGVNYSFKSNNTAGAKTLHHYYVKLDADLNVMSALELKNKG